MYRAWGVRALALVALIELAAAQTAPEMLYQEGLFEETTAGDLAGAIAAYEAVLHDQSSAPSLAARAQFRLAECLWKAWRSEEARGAYSRVRDHFARATALVEAAENRIREIDSERSKVRQIRQHHWEVPARELATILSRPASILSDATIAFRAGEDGRLEGIEIASLRENALLARYGFQVGDVIRKVNGKSLVRLSELSALLAPLAAVERVVVEIGREGQKTVLVYTIQK